MDEEKSKIFKSLKPYPIKIYYLQSLAKEIQGILNGWKNTEYTISVLAI
jgi:hypothetical protein